MYSRSASHDREIQSRPMVTLNIAWKNVKKRAKVTGRWHDNRHTFITALAESGEAGDKPFATLPVTYLGAHAEWSTSHITIKLSGRVVQALVRRKRRKTWNSSDGALQLP